MKILVTTQYMEDYGYADGNPGYWKYKGGNTYILEDVSIEEAQSSEVYDELKNLVAYSNPASQEYITGEDLIDDCEDLSNYCQEWENPTVITRKDGKWLARVETSRSIQTWEMLPQQDRANWSQVAKEMST